MADLTEINHIVVVVAGEVVVNQVWVIIIIITLVGVMDMEVSLEDVSSSYASFIHPFEGIRPLSSILHI